MSNEFTADLAVVIGIRAYDPQVGVLTTPIGDAKGVAELLQVRFGYEVILRLDDEATLEKLRSLLLDELPPKVPSGSRLLVYFAGHGVAQDSVEIDGPQGYLVPHGATSRVETHLPMSELYAALQGLPCRHLLVILDCCFGGTFRTSRRPMNVPGDLLYEERYRHWLRHPARWGLTSVAHDEYALDIPDRRRGHADGHSPFAAALLEGLAGEADLRPAGGDGVITLAELYAYIQDRLVPHQSPLSFPLPGQSRGEFVFRDSRPARPLVSAEQVVRLDESQNPYRGLSSYRSEDTELYFGRESAVSALVEHVRSHLLTVVVGPSGSGKSSLIHAGLLPTLRDPEGDWVVPLPLRVGQDPFIALFGGLTAAGGPPSPSAHQLRYDPAANAAWAASRAADFPDQNLLIVIDQAEEVITRDLSGEEQRPLGSPPVSQVLLSCLENLIVSGAGRLRVLLAVRSDYEADLEPSKAAPLASLWRAGRFLVTPLSREELRQVIQGPAARKALYFDDSDLVEHLTDEVVGMPGALPLLSYALSRLFVAYLRNGRGDRQLTVADLASLESDSASAPGGVIRILRIEADRAARDLPDSEHRETLWRVLLRMVDLGGAQPARRQVPPAELDFAESGENSRVSEVLFRFTDLERLLVSSQGGIEMAHDQLLVVWPELARKIEAARVYIPIHRRLTETAVEWAIRAIRPRRGLDLQLLALVQEKALPAAALNRVEKEYLFAACRERRVRTRIQWTAVATILLLGLGSLFFFYRSIQQKELTDIQTSENLAHAADAANRQEDFAAGAFLALDSLKLHQVDAARSSLAQAKNWNWPLVSLLRGNKGPLSGISYSPDGSWLVTTTYSGDNHVARIWNAKTFEAGPVLSHSGRIYNAIFHPNSRRVGVSDYSDHVWVWDFSGSEAQLACSLRHENVGSLAFEARGDFLISYSSRLAKVWKLAGCNSGTPLTEPSAILENLEFTNYGRFAQPGIFLTASSNELLIWGLETGQPSLRQRLVHPQGVTDGDISTDGKWALTSGGNGTARVWDLATTPASLLQELRHDGKINTGRFSKDAQFAVTASADGTAKIWEKQRGVFRFKSLLAHGSEVKEALFDPSAQWVASWSYPRKDAAPGSQEKQILWIWDAGQGQRTAALQAGSAIAADFSPEGDMLAVAGFDHAGRVWKIGAARTQIPRDGSNGDDEKKTTLGLDDKGQALLVDRYNEQIRVWDIPEARERFLPLKFEDQNLPSVHISRDGTRIVASDGRSFAQWSTENGTPIDTEPGSTSRFGGRFIGHSGPMVVIESFRYRAEGDLQLLDTTTNEVFKVPSSLETVKKILISENRRFIVLAGTEMGTARRSESSDIEIWDVRNSHLVDRFRSNLNPDVIHPEGLSLAGQEGGPSGKFTVLVAGEKEPRSLTQDGWVISARFSPDGSKLVTASREGVARIWDTKSWERQVDLAHGAWVTHATYDSRGELIATTATDGSTKVWSASSHQLLAVLQHHEPQRISFFSPDSALLVSQSMDKATVWRWREELIDPEEARLHLRFSLARQLKGTVSETESFLLLPAGLPVGDTSDSIREAAKSLLASPPSHSTIAAAVAAVRQAQDPALAWIALFEALAGHPRSNGYRLLVLEELERQVPSSSENGVLSLLLAATRAEGAEDPEDKEGVADRMREDIQEEAQTMMARGNRHPAVLKLANSKK